MQTLKRFHFGLIAGAALAVAAQPAAGQQTSGTDASDRAAFEEGLRQSPGWHVIEAMRRHYPDEANVILERALQQVRQNLDDLPVALASFRREMEAFLRARGPDLAAAPASSLLNIARRRLALARLLQQEDPQVCSEWASGPIRDVRRLSPGAYAQVNELAVAMLETAAAGKTSPVRRNSAGPAPAAVASWTTHMRAADGRPDALGLLANPSRFAAAPAARRCQIIAAMYDAVLRMPEAEGGNMMAYFLKTEMQQSGR